MVFVNQTLLVQSTCSEFDLLKRHLLAVWSTRTSTIAYFRVQQSAHIFYYEIQVPSYAAAPIYSKVTWVDGIDRIPSVIWSYSTEPVQRFTVSNISLSNITEGAKLIRSQSMLTHFHLRTDQTDLEALKQSLKLNVWIIQLRLLSRTTIIRASHARNIPVHCAL